MKCITKVTKENDSCSPTIYLLTFFKPVRIRWNSLVSRPEPIYNTRVSNAFYISSPGQILQIYDRVVMTKTTWPTLRRKWEVCFRNSICKRCTAFVDFSGSTYIGKGRGEEDCSYKDKTVSFLRLLSITIFLNI